MEYLFNLFKPSGTIGNDYLQDVYREAKGIIGQGGFPATRNLGGNRKRTKIDSHRGKVNQGGRDTIHEKFGGNTHHKEYTYNED